MRHSILRRTKLLTLAVATTGALLVAAPSPGESVAATKASKVVTVSKKAESSVDMVDISENGRWLLYRDHGNIFLYDHRKRASRKVVLRNQADDDVAPSLSGNGRYVVYVSDRSRVFRWDRVTGKRVRIGGRHAGTHSQSTWSLATSSDGQTVAYLRDDVPDPVVALWTAATGRSTVVETVENGWYDPVGIGLSGDASTLVLSYRDWRDGIGANCSTALWDMTTATRQFVSEAHPCETFPPAPSVTRSGDQVVWHGKVLHEGYYVPGSYLWDREKGTSRRVPRASDARIAADGKWVVFDGVKRWNVKSGKVRGRKTKNVGSSDISADGKAIAFIKWEKKKTNAYLDAALWRKRRT